MAKFNFSISLIKKELTKLQKGEWVIFDKPDKNEIAFLYTRGKNRPSARTYFSRYELGLAHSEKEIAEIVIRRIGGVPPSYSEITMVKLLEDL